MKTPIIWGLLLLVTAVASSDVNGSTEAEECVPERCRLPDCRCSGTDIPGGIRARSVPQFVTLTFDDAVTPLNMVTYRRLLYNRRNSNNCPIGTTFYMSHEYTDYQSVNELYNRGFEIALHSITHKHDQDYWRNADYETLVKEFVDQRTQVAHFANIPSNAVKGIRMPFLQMAGDAQFIMMANHSLLYDASMATINLINPGLWPYSLQYRSTQECNVPPCPTSSIHGPWVLPILAWRDLEDFPCPFVDACSRGPNVQDEDGWYNFFLKNFENHYLGNRAPFGFYVHEAFIRTHPAVERALARFLNLLNSLHDVFMVNSEEVIEWVRNPIPLTEYRKQRCRTFQPTTCRRGTPCRIVSDHNGNTYYMPVCTACPRRYPWIGNPLGTW